MMSDSLRLWLKPAPATHGVRCVMVDERGDPFPHGSVAVTEVGRDGSLALTLTFDRRWLIERGATRTRAEHEIAFPPEMNGQPIAFAVS